MSKKQLKNIRAVLILFIILLNTIKVQAQNTFEKIIDTLGCYGVLCIQETFDGGYVFTGTNSVNGGEVLVTKLDSIGTIEWVKTFDGPGAEGGTYIEQLPDSGYIVNALYDGGLYSKSWLLRLDVNGDSLWTRVFSAGIGATNVYLGNSMAVLNNAIYGLTGYFTPIPFSNGCAYFIGALSNGLLIANKVYNYSATLSSDARAIDKAFDGGFIMAGVIGMSSSTVDIYVLRTNAYGDTLWTRTYNNSTTDVAFAVQQTEDSGFIIAGVTYDTTLLPPKYNTYLIKTDSIGDTLWTKQHYSLEPTETYSIQQTTDNGFVGTGRIVNGNPLNSDVHLFKTDSLGDTLWTRQFGDSSADDGYFVRQTKDGGYIICGTANIPSTLQVGAYIIKTDSLGMVGNGTGIAEVNNPFDFSVYPNPSSGNFTILFKGIPRKNAELKIYNIMNQCVYTGTLSSYKKESVDLHHLPNGIYIATLYYGARTVSEKVIIHK
ncbi:MAG: T9SS type A sorting domain-containing protein [Bacteroidia bacterium]|jgi:hypothetical protein